MQLSKTIYTLLLTIPLSATNLSELIESGLKNNSLIKKTELQTQLMQSRKEENQAKRFGSLDLVGSYTHYNLPRTLAPIVPSALSPGSSVDTTQDLFTTGVQYSMPLFTGGALKQQVEIDELASQMSQSRTKLSREELIYNIRSLYLTALSLQEIQASQEQFVEALEKLEEVVSYGVQIGKKAKIELLKAQNDVQGAKGKVALTKSSLRRVKSTLKAVTHFPSIGQLEALDVSTDKDVSSIDFESVDNLERFKLQDLEIAKNAKFIKKVQSQEKPQVGLTAYAGDNYDFDQLPLEHERLWQVAVNVKWNLFDFGANSAKVQQAKIAKLQAVIAKEATAEGYQKLFAKAVDEVERGYANYQSNQSQYNLLEETEKIEKARYDAGVATLNDLLLAKSKTELAKSQMIQSRYAYQNGIFYIDYLLEQGER